MLTILWLSYWLALDDVIHERFVAQREAAIDTWAEVMAAW